MANDYINNMKIKATGVAYDIHDSRLGDSIGSITSIVQESRTIADIPLSENIQASALNAKLAAANLANDLFTVTDVVIG